MRAADGHAQAQCAAGVAARHWRGGGGFAAGHPTPDDHNLKIMEIQCRSEPARDSGVSVKYP
ncbi:hypothetical protein EMIT0P265_20460 [Pseudomonas zeae]